MYARVHPGLPLRRGNRAINGLINAEEANAAGDRRLELKEYIGKGKEWEW